MTTEYFGGSTTISMAREFKERKKYRSRVAELQVPTIDTLHDKILYGHLDKNNHIITPVPAIAPFGEPASELNGLAYVVDLFDKFRNFYIDIVTKNSNIGIPKSIEDLTPVKSYDSLEEAYNLNKGIISSTLLEIIKERTQGAYLTLIDFVNLANEIMFLQEMSEFKLTKSGYSLTSCYFSGLYVDMSKNYSTHTDQDKGVLIEDPFFKCYCEFAAAHGFLVDINAPWRLVLNLDSKVATENILNGRPEERFDDLYSDLYTSIVGYDDYWELEIFYQFLYNEYNIYRFSQEESTTPVVWLPPTRDARDTSPGNWKTKLWLKCVIINRLREMGLMISSEPSELFDEIYNKSIDMVDLPQIYSIDESGFMTNPNSPIGYIEAKCSKLLDQMIK